MEFREIRPVGAEFFHADKQKAGRTDGRTYRQDGGNNGFSQFCKRA
jgi:hypothetical protein